MTEPPLEKVTEPLWKSEKVTETLFSARAVQRIFGCKINFDTAESEPCKGCRIPRRLLRRRADHRRLRGRQRDLGKKLRSFVVWNEPTFTRYARLAP